MVWVCDCTVLYLSAVLYLRRMFLHIASPRHSERSPFIGWPLLDCVALSYCLKNLSCTSKSVPPCAGRSGCRENIAMYFLKKVKCAVVFPV